MKKEILTIENIKKDLLECRKNGYTAFVVFTITALIFGGITYGFYAASGQILFVLSIGSFALLMLCGSVLAICDIFKSRRIIASDPVIVKDTFLGLESRGGGPTSRCRTYMMFANYGDYFTPYNEYHYKWSEYFHVSTETLFERVREGEEFYLLLDKPHTGKILKVYRCNWFELEEKKV